MWATILSKVVGTLPQAVIDYYKTKRELKQELSLAKLRGKITLAEAKAERKAAQQQHVQNWEMSYVQAQATSWKDEIVLAVFLAPFVGVFIPGVQDYILTGFDYLAAVPVWWTGITVAISLAIFGIRHKRANQIQAPGLQDRDKT